MKTLRFRHMLWGALALGVLLMALGVLALRSEWGLNELVRPRLEQLAAARLQAELTIGRLAWEEHRLVISEVRLQRAGHYRIVLPRARLTLSLRDLLQRHVTALELSSPDIELFPASANDSGPSAGLPGAPPLTVGRLVVRDALLHYAHEQRPLTLSDVQLTLHGSAAFQFALSGQLAGAAPVPFALAGSGCWRAGLHMTLSTISWNGRKLLREPLTLALPAGGGTQLDLSLGLEELVRADMERWLAALSLPSPLPPGWDFLLNTVRLTGAWRNAALEARIDVGIARLTGPGLTMPLSALTLNVAGKADRWQGEGTCRLAGDNPANLTVRMDDDGLRGRLTLKLADPAQVQKLLLGQAALSVAGGVDVALEAAWGAARRELVLEARGRPGEGVSSDALLDISGLRLLGTATRQGEAWRGAARLYLADRLLATAEGDAERLQAVLKPVGWAQLRQVLVAGRRPAAVRTGQGLTASVTATRQKTGWRGRASLQAGELIGLGGGLHDIACRTRFAWRSAKLDLTEGTARARLDLGERGGGPLAAAFSGHWQDSGWWARFDSLTAGPMELLSADGLGGLDGGQVNVSGRVSGKRAGGPVDIRLQGRLAVAEALWGAWYGDLSDWPVQAELRGRWQPADSALKVTLIKVDLGDMVTLRGQGRLAPDDPALTGTLALADLAHAWNERGRPLASELQPALADLSLAGALTTAFDVRRIGATWRVQGEAQPRALTADWPSARLRVRGLAGRLPLALHWPLDAREATSGEGAARSGRLAWSSFDLGPVALGRQQLQLAVTPNRLALQTPLALEIGGGRVVVEQLRLAAEADGLAADMHIQGARIDLARLTDELGVVPMTGTIDADLGRIRYAGGVLQSDGEARIEAFGGILRVRNMRLDATSLNLPQLYADLDFSGIDLYGLTRTFSFGAMNGVMDGYVHGLRLFGTTPSQFRARLETRLEGRRNISVKALNNLSILSQGGLSAALSRGIYRFIDFYRYRRIGIACTLDRDVFLLRGTARPDSPMFLVDGGILPPKLDIIAPQRPISFREMLRRLQRLDRTGRRAD